MTIGLAAIGSAGDWQIDLDEVIGPRPRNQSGWSVTIANKTFCIQVQIKNPLVISEILDLLKTGAGELYIGTCHGADVIILKENSRIQFRIFRRPKKLRARRLPGLIELNVTGKNINTLLKAIEDLFHDLNQTEHTKSKKFSTD